MSKRLTSGDIHEFFSLLIIQHPFDFEPYLFNFIEEHHTKNPNLIQDISLKIQGIEQIFSEQLEKENLVSLITHFGDGGYNIALRRPHEKTLSPKKIDRTKNWVNQISQWVHNKHEEKGTLVNYSPDFCDLPIFEENRHLFRAITENIKSESWI